MSPSFRPRLPKWVLVACCLTPCFALVGIVIASICGTPIDSTVWIPLVWLCHRTIAWILGIPPPQIIHWKNLGTPLAPTMQHKMI